MYSVQEPSDNEAFAFFLREPVPQILSCSEHVPSLLPCILLANIMVQTEFVRQAIGDFSKTTPAKHRCNSRELVIFIKSLIILTSLIHAQLVPTELKALYPNGPQHRNQNIAKARAVSITLSTKTRNQNQRYRLAKKFGPLQRQPELQQLACLVDKPKGKSNSQMRLKTAAA
jgi:hypothetical protein